MLAMQYAHRLPADYDLARIHDRIQQRGPLWDDTEGLVLKAFVTQTAGSLGATGHVYSSIYLWQGPEWATRFLASDRFQAVVDGFGRPRIDTWLPLVARRGPAMQARALYKEERLLPASPSMGAVTAVELEHNAQLASQSETLAAWSVLDVGRWTVLRFFITSAEPLQREGVEVYDVKHLSRPGLAGLS